MTQPVHTFTEHLAAVKAIAWSPHHHGLLASGGGTADRCIRFWNTLTGQVRYFSIKWVETLSEGTFLLLLDTFVSKCEFIIDISRTENVLNGNIEDFSNSF